uniref:Uncharacterized protein n=1 Tax=Bracon brevicornis TaxID=1563983 RepID=A0A6V7KUY5_9HYME
MTAVKSSLSQIPVLIDELKEVKVRVRGLEENQQALRADLDALAASSPAVTSGVADRLDGLEQNLSLAVDRFASLEGSVSRLNSEQLRQSAEITISGLTFDEERADLRRLAYAVISTVLPAMKLDHSVSARLMRRKSRPVTSSSTSEVLSRSPAIAVTFLASILAREVVLDKRKIGKLHSSKLDAGLLAESGLTSPLPSTLINIFEMLSSETFELRNAAIVECGCRNFSTFVRDGSVYVKKRKEDTPMLITSIEHLKNYCEGSH